MLNKYLSYQVKCHITNNIVCVPDAFFGADVILRARSGNIEYFFNFAYQTQANKIFDTKLRKSVVRKNSVV